MAELSFFLALLLASFFANKSACVKSTKKGERASKLYFFLSFLSLWFLLVFSKSGPDYENYRDIVEAVSWQFPIYKSSELGFNYFCILLKELIPSNPDAVIACIKTITLLLVYLSFYKLRNVISISVSVSIYGMIYFLPSFFLLSLALASAFCLYSFSILYSTKSFVKSFLLCLIGAQFHTSCYSAILVYVVIYFALKNPNSFERLKWLYVFSAILGSVSLSLIISYLSSTFESFHYDIYYNDTDTGVGLKVMVEYFVLFLVYIETKKIKDREMSNVFFIFFVVTLLITIIGYSISVGSRLLTVFMAQNVVMLSQVIRQARYKIHNYKQVTMLVSLFLLIEGVLTIYSNFYGDGGFSSNKFFNPFI